VRNKLLCLVTMALALAAGNGYGAQQRANEESQQFWVLRATHFVTASETLTNADARCAIAGAGRDATVQCRSTGGTAKASYHYNAALILDDAGTAYVIACRVSLISRACKALNPGVMLHGTAGDGEHLAISDEDKVRNYQILLSKHVGGSIPAQASSEHAVPNMTPAGKQSGAEPPHAAATGSAGAKTPSNTLPTNTPPPNPQANPASDPSVTCMSYTGACVAFVSEPLGADVFVDGKFVGNTPSTLTLTAGSHEIRIEAAALKRWSRTFDAVAGSKITIRAILEPLSR
jgi:PEGA domain